MRSHTVYTKRLVTRKWYSGTDEEWPWPAEREVPGGEIQTLNRPEFRHCLHVDSTTEKGRSLQRERLHSNFPRDFTSRLCPVIESPYATDP